MARGRKIEAQKLWLTCCVSHVTVFVYIAYSPKKDGWKMNILKKLRAGETCVALNVIKLLFVLAATIAGIYLFGRAALLTLPFLIGFSLSLMLARPVRFLNRRMHISQTIGSGISVALVVLVICAIVGVLIFSLYVEMRGLIVRLPTLYNNFVAYMEKVIDYIGTEYSEWITPDMLLEFEALINRLRDAVLSLINRITRGVWHTAVSVPQMFIGFMMMFFSTFFFLRDKEKIVSYMDKHIPSAWRDTFAKAKKELFVSLFAYIRAILILAAITFVELVIGFSILGVNYGILIAFICAVLDALPAIGTGWVLTPWGAACLIMGRYKLGIGLLALYLITWIVRQLLEPRIVGGQIGMHPLLLLFAMYLGMQLWGFIGLLAGPLTAIVLRSFLRLYFSGRTLKEVLYSGVEQPSEDGTQA